MQIKTKAARVSFKIYSLLYRSYVFEHYQILLD